MTLTIHTEEDSQRQLKVTVEVPENQVQAQMRRTARDLAQTGTIFPGFAREKFPIIFWSSGLARKRFERTR